MRTLRVLAIVVLLAACTPSPSQADAAVELPANAHVLSGAAAELVFHQCSRNGPEFATADFEPDVGSIRDLEAKLPAALSAAEGQVDYDGRRVTVDLGSYYREYAAYMSGGRRKIYGNFAPLKSQMGKGPIVICDGGSAFFGVEYDVERREITAMAFNGGG